MCVHLSNQYDEPRMPANPWAVKPARPAHTIVLAGRVQLDSTIDSDIIHTRFINMGRPANTTEPERHFYRVFLYPRLLHKNGLTNRSKCKQSSSICC